MRERFRGGTRSSSPAGVFQGKHGDCEYRSTATETDVSRMTTCIRTRNRHARARALAHTHTHTHTHIDTRRSSLGTMFNE